MGARRRGFDACAGLGGRARESRSLGDRLAGRGKWRDEARFFLVVMGNDDGDGLGEVR